MRSRILAALALALAACGSDPEPPPAASGWVDVPGMTCADGSQTGIGIMRGPADAVLVYLLGGGACWGANDCNADLRAFGRGEFDLGLRFLVTGTILDRTLPGNPFAAWTVVFVPYCTGDVHAGDSVKDYGGTAGSWNHHGYRNLQAAVAQMTADIAPPARVVVSGSSAGGFGALLAHELVRAEWSEEAGVSAALVDDSGPTFIGSAIPDQIRAAWWDAWNLGSTLGTLCPTCGTDLAADLSEIWPVLRANHPADRLALVSTTQDLTMRGFFDDMEGAAFETALADLTAKLDGVGDAAVFRAGGAAQTDHALLFPSAVATYSAGGTTLLDWLSQMATLDPSWASTGP